MTEPRCRSPEGRADDGQIRARLSRVRVWFVDCDDTLFNASHAMLAAIHVRMERFIAERLGVSLEEGRRLQHAYWARYGATFLGLEKHHGIAPKEFFEATHLFDLSEAMPEAFSRSKLRRALKGLPGRLVLVTNGPRCYIRALLPLLGVEDLFESVVSADDMGVAGRRCCKPDAALFAHLAALRGVHPRQCAFIEDSPANLRTAKKLGMLTVWCAGYRKHGQRLPLAHAWADIAVNTLSDLARRTALAAQTARDNTRRPVRGLSVRESPYGERTPF